MKRTLERKKGAAAIKERKKKRGPSIPKAKAHSTLIGTPALTSTKFVTARPSPVADFDILTCHVYCDSLREELRQAKLEKARAECNVAVLTDKVKDLNAYLAASVYNEMPAPVHKLLDLDGSILQMRENRQRREAEIMEMNMAVMQYQDNPEASRQFLKIAEERCGLETELEEIFETVKDYHSKRKGLQIACDSLLQAAKIHAEKLKQKEYVSESEDEADFNAPVTSDFVPAPTPTNITTSTVVPLRPVMVSQGINGTVDNQSVNVENREPVRNMHVDGESLNAKSNQPVVESESVPIDHGDDLSNDRITTDVHLSDANTTVDSTANENVDNSMLPFSKVDNINEAPSFNQKSSFSSFSDLKTQLRQNVAKASSDEPSWKHRMTAMSKGLGVGGRIGVGGRASVNTSFDHYSREVNPLMYHIPKRSDTGMSFNFGQQTVRTPFFASSTANSSANSSLNTSRQLDDMISATKIKKKRKLGGLNRSRLI
eukprot:CFRG0824T1